MCTDVLGGIHPRYQRVGHLAAFKMDMQRKVQHYKQRVSIAPCTMKLHYGQEKRGEAHINCCVLISVCPALPLPQLPCSVYVERPPSISSLCFVPSRPFRKRPFLVALSKKVLVCLKLQCLHTTTMPSQSNRPWNRCRSWYLSANNSHTPVKKQPTNGFRSRVTLLALHCLAPPRHSYPLVLDQI